MTERRRPPWDFDYRPVWTPPAAPGPERELVVATEGHTLASEIKQAISRAVSGEGAVAVTVEQALACPPIFWLLVRSAQALDARWLARVLRAEGVGVRYVASAHVGSQAWAPLLSARGRCAREPVAWAPREPTTAAEPRDGGFWFLGADGGVDADRQAISTGAGTRLAVIDDDADGAAVLELDAEILVGVDRAPRAHAHGTRMVGWAVGAPHAARPFRGVAPDAAPRLYLIPKPGQSVLSLPLALVRAVADGADVVVCATYVEASWSPMLDDALHFAERWGRDGRGTVVVLPTGREASSPTGSVHASLTLSFGDPASDPRVLCVAPASRTGGWFFYRDRKARSRPFANRGPAVRLLAPGDDMADPLCGGERLCHAESSGASAIAAGVSLLVIAENPSLHVHEVFALLETTAEPVAPEADRRHAPFADEHDALPPSLDRDGHNAKHGYGALSARSACLASADPVAWALVRIGETEAARAYGRLRRHEPAVRAAYSNELARWLVRAVIASSRMGHAARALVRHARLLSVDPVRRGAVQPGTFLKQVAVLLRSCLDGSALLEPEATLREEIGAHLACLADQPDCERAWAEIAARIFAPRIE